MGESPPTMPWTRNVREAKLHLFYQRYSRSLVMGQRRDCWTVLTPRYGKVQNIFQNNFDLQRDDCGPGEAAGAVCDTRSSDREEEDEATCFQVTDTELT